MKLRSLEQFEGAIDHEMAWRRHELVNLRANVRASRSTHVSMMVRAGIALLYAHFEGFAGGACRLYVEFVSQKSLRYNQLSTPIFSIALKVRMAALHEASASHVHLEFARFLRNDLEHKVKLPKASIDTRANLSSSVLRDLVVRLGLDYKPFELREKLIDESLLRRRNEIAHGELLDIEPSDYLALHDEIVSMIDDLRIQLLVAARTKGYLSSSGS